MIDFSQDGTRFIYRVSAVCVQHGRLLICRPPELDFWYLPGGRVHHGETMDEALERELIEEVGSPPAASELIWLVENLFSYESQQFHEISPFFQVSLPANAEVMFWDDVTTRIETGDETILEWRWVPIDELHTLDLRPPFLKDRLQRPIAGFERIINRRDA